METKDFFIKFTNFDRHEISKGVSKVHVQIPSTVVRFEKNNSLHDTRMGAFKNIICGTCKMDSNHCIGHFGHIELYFPVINPFFTTMLKKILETFCFKCYNHLKKTCKCGATTEEPPNKKRKIEKVNLIQLIKDKKITPSTKSCYIKMKKNKSMSKTIDNNWTFEMYNYDEDNVIKLLSVKELYDMLVKIPKHKYLKHFPQFTHLTDITDSCFIHNLLVLPTTLRPPNITLCPPTMTKSRKWFPDHITCFYTDVIKKNIQLKNKHNIVETCILNECHSELQNAVNVVFDVSTTRKRLSLNAMQNGGIRQRIDGKSGRIRHNLMGKRVNFSARTVMSGDPALGINEIGVPKSVAENLTIPVHVNRFNIEEIRSGKYNVRYLLKGGDTEQRYDMNINYYSIEIGDVIERSLINGDIVAINRQPTLHRGSILACYVKIFECSTFRLNYSSMISLNMDCDGDEGNLHVPQDLDSRAELEELMLASINIVCSQSNKPLTGLSQDSLLGIYKLSKSIISEEDIHSILYSSNCYCNYDSIKPDIVKPCKMFSGLRIFEFLFHFHEIEIYHYFQKKGGGFLIQDNKVIQGIANKHVVGTESNTIFHQIYLRYGHKKAAEVMHSLQKIATAYLDIEGFSVGISDCVLEYESFDIDGLETYMYESLIKKGEIPDEEKLVDALSKLTQLEPPEKQLQDNRMIDMIDSGSKGSMVKFNQITRCVGQQFESNDRIKSTITRDTRTLPHYSQFDLSLESKGFVKNSFIKGLTPQEFFFHTIPSRISLLDTSLKTSVTGAQYRRLVKSLESVKVVEDKLGNRRVIDCNNNNVIQFNYGEDDLQGEYLKKEI